MQGFEEKTVAGLPADTFWPVSWGKKGLFYNVRLTKEADIAPIRVSVFRAARTFCAMFPKAFTYSSATCKLTAFMPPGS